MRKKKKKHKTHKANSVLHSDTPGTTSLRCTEHQLVWNAVTDPLAPFLLVMGAHVLSHVPPSWVARVGTQPCGDLLEHLDVDLL